MEQDNQIIGGIVGDAISSSNNVIANIGDSIKNGLIDGFNAIVSSIFGVIDPVVDWGCKIVIIYCVIIYFSSKDKKVVSLGIKAFSLYILYLLIRSEL